MQMVRLLLSLAVALTAAAANAAGTVEAALDLARQPATIGWATVAGSTSGGAAADPRHIHVVSSRAELVEALGGDNRANAADQTPAIILVSGTIDLTLAPDGTRLTAEDFADEHYSFERYVDAYDPATYGTRPPAGPLEEARLRSQARQAAHVVINVGSNKTLFGLGETARIVGGGLRIGSADNVIVRNIAFADGLDFFPGWEGSDEGTGNWNAGIDLIEIVGSHHVWIDHNTFSTGAPAGADGERIFGQKLVRADGAVDIVEGSSHVTLTSNLVHDHDKVSLIGGSDADVEDRGGLAVTLAYNWFRNTRQRTPRARFGEVHIFNNLYSGSKSADVPFRHAFGVGIESRILSEANVFDMGKGIRPARIIAHNRGSTMFDRGSLFNGRPVDLVEEYNREGDGPSLERRLLWEPPYPYRLLAADAVADYVRDNAGAGRLAF